MSQQIKVKYEAPKLERYGTITALTASDVKCTGIVIDPPETYNSLSDIIDPCDFLD